MNAVRERALDPDGAAMLTRRELEALRELATGATYEEVAHRMGCSRETVGRHLKAAYGKLGVLGKVDAFLALGWLRVRP